MRTPNKASVLEARLARLPDEGRSRCLPEYRSLAESIRGSRAFPSALRRVKSLADENRLLAVSLLKRRGEMCACEIQAATGLTHATVSHHMSALADAGVVEGRRRGKWMYYRLRGANFGVIP